MGLSGVATADYPNGPFKFETSFYPSSTMEAPGGQSINQTFDQTVVVSASQVNIFVEGGLKSILGRIFSPELLQDGRILAPSPRSGSAMGKRQEGRWDSGLRT